MEVLSGSSDTAEHNTGSSPGPSQLKGRGCPRPPRLTNEERPKVEPGRVDSRREARREPQTLRGARARRRDTRRQEVLSYLWVMLLPNTSIILRSGARRSLRERADAHTHAGMTEEQGTPP